LYVGVPREAYERYFWGEVLGEFAMLSPDREDTCGSQGVYDRAELYFWAGSVALK
jgi:hypothetical protein